MLKELVEGPNRACVSGHLKDGDETVFLNLARTRQGAGTRFGADRSPGMTEPLQLEPSDRLCLEEARERGELVVRLYREGRPEEDGAAIKAHLQDMCARGLLRFEGQWGSKARMQEAELRAHYVPTSVALALLEALERAEAAEAALARKERSRRRTARQEESPFAPSGCIVKP